MARILIILLLILVSCNRGDALVDRTALDHYRRGSYRQCAEVLENRHGGTELDRYLLARSYQELQRIPEALSNFEMIDSGKLPAGPFHSFFQENYCYHYSRALFSLAFRKGQNLTTRQLETAGELYQKTPSDSVYRDDVYSVYLYSLWKSSRFAELTNLKSTNSTAVLYASLGGAALGMTNSLEQLFNVQSAYFSFLYRDLTNYLIPEYFQALDPVSLGRAFLLTLENQDDETAAYILNVHYQKTHDAEFQLRNQALLDFRAGRRDKALQSLGKHCRTGRADQKTIGLYLNLARKKGEAGPLIEAATLASAYGSYMGDYISILARQKKAPELSRLFSEKVGDPSFRRNYAPALFRALLRLDADRAATAVEQLLKYDSPLYFRYADAMLKQRAGRTEEAYRGFLDIVLTEPFTYEWLVARGYEKALRDSYRPVFDQKLKAWLEKLPRLSREDRALNRLGLSIAVRESVPLDYQNGIEDERKFFAARVSNQLWPLDSGLNQMVTELKSDTTGLSAGFSAEIAEYLDRVSTSPQARIALVYRHSDYFAALAQGGTVVNRINHYLTRLFGGRQYQMLLPLDFLNNSLYPAPPEIVGSRLIKKESRVPWVLAAVREESHFDRDALSGAGAVGIAQIMPYTADAIKKSMHKLHYSLYDSGDNLEMGLVHLNYLFARYQDDEKKALAAYNAGEGAVNGWARKYGFTNELWTECIEYDETRDYVKKITLTRFFYEFLMSRNPGVPFSQK